jgi:hypothetical protein
MKRHYDRKRRPDEFQIGDYVWLDARDFATERPSKKLDYKRLGPFKVVEKIGNLAYRLQLPKTFKIHPVLPAARLEKVRPDEWERPQPKVTLKVRDPTTNEFVNFAASRLVHKLTQEQFDTIPFRLLPTLITNPVEDDRF